MFYALIGIPLGLVMFQSIGERLNNFSSFVIRNVKRVLKYENIEASETNLIFVVTVRRSFLARSYNIFAMSCGSFTLIALHDGPSCVNGQHGEIDRAQSTKLASFDGARRRVRNGSPSKMIAEPGRRIARKT